MVDLRYRAGNRHSSKDVDVKYPVGNDEEGQGMMGGPERREGGGRGPCSACSKCGKTTRPLPPRYQRTFPGTGLGVASHPQFCVSHAEGAVEWLCATQFKVRAHVIHQLPRDSFFPCQSFPLCCSAVVVRHC